MRIGTVCYATSQGLGHLAKSFYDAGVVTDVMIYQHPHGEQRAPTHREWYPPGTHIFKSSNFDCREAERFLDDLEWVLFFETPFSWEFANRCRERGVKTAIIPMYEWFLQRPPHKFDLFINPSLLDQQYFPQGVHIPIPVEPHLSWSLRERAGHFLHNAGHIGSRNHKGTLELLQAMKFVKSNISLTMRCQNAAGLKRLIDSAGVADDPRIYYTDKEIDRDQLFNTDFDVYIAPEKYNGLSLPLQEAFASGMMVMTTNRFPHNQWLPEEPLIPVSGVHRAQTMRGHLEFEESIVSPEAIAAKIDFWAGKDITSFSRAGANYGEENSWEALKPRYLEAFGARP